MRAIALCFKKYLKPEEAYIYTNLGHTQFSKKVEMANITKTPNGYYRREELDQMLEGNVVNSTVMEIIKKMRL